MPTRTIARERFHVNIGERTGCRIGATHAARLYGAAAARRVAITAVVSRCLRVAITTGRNGNFAVVRLWIQGVRAESRCSTPDLGLLLTRSALPLRTAPFKAFRRSPGASLPVRRAAAACASIDRPRPLPQLHLRFQGRQLCRRALLTPLQVPERSAGGAAIDSPASLALSRLRIDKHRPPRNRDSWLLGQGIPRALPLICASITADDGPKMYRHACVARNIDKACALGSTTSD